MPSGFDNATTAFRAAHAALERGDMQSAEAHCRHSISLGRDDAEAWTLLGQILRRTDHEATEAALACALARDPRFADAHFHLGNLRREQGRHAEAVTAYETAAAIVPGHPSVLNNLALALEGIDQPGRAQSRYREVLRTRPDHRQALGNLAHLLCRERDYPAALPLCEEYLRRFPDADAAVWIDQGICCEHFLRDGARAEACYRQAMTLAPDDPIASLNLGSLLIDRGDHEGAEAALRAAVALDPNRLYATTMLALARQYLCQWDGLEALHSRIAAALDAGVAPGDAANPFATLSMPVSALAQRRAAESWARFWRPAPARTPKAAPAMRRHDATLRLGYVSTDFRAHPIAWLLGEVWERIDRARFESFAYSIGPREDSPLCRRIETAFDRFVDCNDDTVAETAQRIRADGIEILIDLNGYTQHSRHAIFALRPAPLQASWLGYLGTLGTDSIDFIITDRFVTPEAAQSDFSERFLYLPDCCMPSDTRRDTARIPPSRSDCGLPPDGFVFCCFNDTYKILPRVFDVWMRLLADVSGSVLWLSPANSTAIDNLRREARARGIAASRLVIAPRVPLDEHLARQRLADLFLDTGPYNAGATANDALLAGLPVLTCAGDTMASRIAGSELMAVGLPELVTTSLDDYATLARRLATDPALLAIHRRRLAENRASAPLFDTARFVRNLEAALLAAWDDHAARAAFSTKA